MTEQGTVWEQTAQKWTEVAGQLTDDDWAKPTTCEEFTVRQLVDHVLHWQAMGGGILGAGTEAGATWDEIRPALAGALENPANLEGTSEAFGGMPKQQILGLLITDLLLHSWDLARSIGADETLPPAAVDAAMMGLSRMPEEMLRGGTMFGPAIDVPESASAQDKLIAFSGRRP